jgi:D-alanine-D-alanine ligase
MKNIAILMGGNSAEKQVSIKSANTIYNNIDSSQYEKHKVKFIEKDIFIVEFNQHDIKLDTNDFSFTYNKEKKKFDLIFIMIHGDPGENGKLCSYFEKINLPYTSCNQKISQLTFNKLQCNTLLNQMGYKVPILYDIEILENITLPCIIKPVNTGSSFGVNKVNHSINIADAIKDARKYSDKIMIEEFIKGKELTCAVFNFKDNKSHITTLPITEIISENEIFDYDAKYNGKAQEITPANISNHITENIEKISKNIYLDLNLKGIIRIDFILHNETPYIIEINTIPGFSEESILPQMLRCANIKMKTFLSWQIKSILH